MLKPVVTKLLRGAVGLLAVLALTLTAAAQGRAAAGDPWTPLDDVPRSEALREAWVRPVEYRAFRLDVDLLAKTLLAAPLEGSPQAANPLTLTLPHPAGGVRRFAVVESSVMEPELQAKHPEIRTFLGQGIDEPATTLRCELTPNGFTAQVLGPGGAWLIDPYTKGDTSLVTSYFLARVAKRRPPFRCETLENAALGPARMQLRGTVAATRRQYRFAASCTGELTQWAGGQPQALALVTTAISRLNGIYETELAVRFVLIGAETSLIFTDPAADPFSDPSNGVQCHTENQGRIDFTIGSANYDIGHVLHRVASVGENNGVASLNSVCVGGLKAHGYTAYNNPADPLFVSDYLAHEVGHQFGAHHPHNNCGGSPGDADQYLVEPGSGTTIMGYAGICGGTNVQPNSDPYFNGINFSQMISFINAGGGCAVTADTGNTAPTVAAGPPHVIPLRTPFTLTASGSDSDGDAITYCWEPQDAGPRINLPTGANDNGTSPIIRSRAPVSSPSRTVPRLQDLLANVEPPAEALPRVARTMRWRVTARDNRAGGGGVSWSETTVQAVDTGAPFRVTSPNAAGTFNGTIAVTWDVAGTTAPPVSCSSVKISLSLDGGLTFPTVLAASVPNTGTANVTLPAANTASARIKVEAVGNIFFDVSDQNFTIGNPAAGAVFAPGGRPTVDDTQGNGNSNAAADPGETALRLFIPLANTGQTTATNVTATLVSDTPTATVVQPTASYGSIVNGQTRTNTPAFVLNLSSLHVCGRPVRMHLEVSSDQGGGVVPVRLATGVLPGTNQLVARYSGAVVAIPDGNADGVNLAVNVTGVGTVADLNLNIDHQPGVDNACSDNPGSMTVGLAHGFVGDLVVKLTSPSGTTVTLIDRPGRDSSHPDGSAGSNFCDTVLDDDGSFDPIQGITTSGNPYSGSFTPASPLGAFIGEPADGTWVLNVSDRLPGDTGRVQFFALEFQIGDPVCAAPRAVTGACCALSGTCSLVTQAACTGVYQGDNAPCSPSPCPQPTGACCAAGACTVREQAACSGAGSAYQGDGTTCAPNPCPPPVGACCAPSGACSLAQSGGCSGAFQGVGVACTPGLCPRPQGACCPSGGGACVFVTQAQCGGGSWQPGAACSPDPCATAVQGTCCASDGSCAVGLASACMGAWNPGGACTPTNPCPQPTGACCQAGACTVTAEVDCAGGWSGGTPCSPTLCPAIGACCNPANGACSITTQASCPDNWSAQVTSCTPNLCPPPPRGTCCAGTACGVTTLAQCAGQWNSGGTCTPNPCTPPTGACCSPAGGCSVATPAACQGAGGVYQGTGSGCSPSPCTSATVVCCRGASCALVAAAGCTLDPGTQAGLLNAGPGAACNTSLNDRQPCCKADYNKQGGVEILDIFAFLTDWFGNVPYADYDAQNGVDIIDIFSFLTGWFAGGC